MTGWDGSIPIG